MEMLVGKGKKGAGRVCAGKGGEEDVVGLGKVCSCRNFLGILDVISDKIFIMFQGFQCPDISIVHCTL